MRSVEEQIEKALAEGAFDDLPGKGKPLNLDAYFQTPEHLRAAYSVLKSGGFVPEEAQLFKEIEDLKAQIKNCEDPERGARLRKTLNEKSLSLSLQLERNRRTK